MLRLRSASGSRTGSNCCRSTRITARSSPTDRTLDVHPGVDAMAEEISRVCGPREAAGLPALRRFRRPALPPGDAQTSSTATSTRRSISCARTWPRLIARRRPAPTRAGDRSLSARPTAAAAVRLPGDVRGPLAVRRAGDLRRHHLHGLRRRRVFPARRNARAFRARWRARPKSTASRSGTARPRPRWSVGRSGHRRAHRRRRTNPSRRRRAHRRPADRLPRAAGRRRRRRHCATRRRASCCSPDRAGVTPDGTPHDLLRPGLAGTFDEVIERVG